MTKNFSAITLKRKTFLTMFSIIDENPDRYILKTQIAWLITFLGLLTVCLMAVIFFRAENWLDFKITIAMFPFIALSIFFLLKKQPHNSLITVVLVGFVTTWVGALTRGGLDDIGIQALYPFFVLASALLPAKLNKILALISILMVGLLVFLEMNGYFIHSTDPNSYAIKGVLITAILMILVIIMRFIMNSLDQANKNLNTAKSELEQLILEKNAFLSMLSHDMKSPLTTIGLYADLLRNRPEAVQQKPRIAESIKQSQTTLLDLVNNILDIERLQMGETIDLKSQMFDFSALVKSCVESFKEISSNRKSEINLDIKEKKINIVGDQQQLSRVITNLISNAIKYSPKGRPVSVIVDRLENQNIVLKVKDNGYGIPEGDLQHIFKTYHRVERNKDKATGSGLGLSIVQAIVEGHNGRIEVNSKIGQGSTFSVRLPARPYPLTLQSSN